MRYIVILLFLASCAFGSNHPGNIFVAGEEVRVVVPVTWHAWRVLDVDGNQIGNDSAGNGTATLGKLPVGYYEVRELAGSGVITAGVIAKNVPTEISPIAVDAAMSWFYDDEERIRDACTLCRLAGVTWVRDRLSWPEIETARGIWADQTRYERSMRIQHEAGLKVLQVNHISPPWATNKPSRFPEDLRDVYNFYRGLAKRWDGLADAIEPWNEPDIELFGGHTGCEIASFQKAAYLGLKAGDPQLPVCQSVFAIDRAETLDEFGVNEVHPYFDLYNLHHYTGMHVYPRLYGRHRAVSGGRPMWTTEFNLPVHWADEKTKEPSEEELRVQAFRVAKVFATALHEGTEKAFYFILGHYVERKLQYGLVHTDITPRPAYVAFAAVGRLLSGAKPIGRVKLEDEKLKAYVFETEVDGAVQETLVAWSETKETSLEVPPAAKCYDYLGRELPQAPRVELTRAPVFCVLARGKSKKLTVEPPPSKPPWRAGTAFPIVLQLIGNGDVGRSAFQLDQSRKLRLVVYNFGENAAFGTLDLEGAVVAKRQVAILPGQREERIIHVNSDSKVTVRLDLGNVGQPIVSARVKTTP